MSRRWSFVPLCLATGLVLAADAPAPAPEEKKDQAKPEGGPKLLDGMSILGNQEAPKALVIVPWKSSEIGEALGISPSLGDSRQPVDREVFMRALSYHEIRSETAQPPAAARRSKS
jgi:hypothetical protein